MKRFASLTTTAALASALICIGPVSQAQNVINMYLVPISPLNVTYNPGDVIYFRSQVDIPDNNVKPITLTLGAAIAYDSGVFDINGIYSQVDTSAYPPKPTAKLWDLVPPPAYSMTATGPSGVPLDTYQYAVGHTKQTIQPGNKTTSIPGGTYTIATCSFPVLASAKGGSTTVYLPTAYGFGGSNAAMDFINNTDSSGTNHAILAFPNTGGKYSSLTYNVKGGTPAPSSLLVVAMGALPVAGGLRRRRAKSSARD